MTDYITLANLKSRIQKTDVTDDTILTAIITSASLAVDRFCNRPDGFVALTNATARTFAGSGSAVQRIDECTAITLVEVKDSATDTTYVSWTAGDWLAFRGDPESPDFNRTPYTHLMVDPTGDYAVFSSGAYSGKSGFRRDDLGRRRVPTVRVTAKWGYATTVPGPIQEAAAALATRWYKRFQSAFADTLGNAELGTLLYRQTIDPDIKMMLTEGRYIKPSV
ncbi:MAG: hypothetical protein WC455_18250 [Dehalococcoidia bacterium]|jgi:hypothetical protein